MIRKYFQKKSNILFILLFAFLLFKQFPILKNNISQNGKVIDSRELNVLNPDESASTLFPPKGSRAIAIFWASWCGPCKIEMNRLKKSVESGAIPKKLIFAINPFESNTESKKFIAENDYPFTFLEASPLSEEIGVRATPTTIFIDNGVITEMSSGMSLWGIWKAEFFL